VLLVGRAGQIGPTHPKPAGPRAKNEQRAGRTGSAGSGGLLVRLWLVSNGQKRMQRNDPSEPVNRPKLQIPIHTFHLHMPGNNFITCILYHMLSRVLSILLSQSYLFLFYVFFLTQTTSAMVLASYLSKKQNGTGIFSLSKVRDVRFLFFLHSSNERDTHHFVRGSSIHAHH